MTKKKVYWYGINRINVDLTVTKLEVKKETATRLYLAESAKVGSLRATEYINKLSGYERWYPTREQAVIRKLKWLEEGVAHKGEDLTEAKNLLAKFKAQEDV